jgi:hypothetical protein
MIFRCYKLNKSNISITQVTEQETALQIGTIAAAVPVLLDY